MRSLYHVALIEPEIPPNTGNIARLCGATFTPLHIVGKPGFRMDDKAVRRAGLDYWEAVELHQHLTAEHLFAALPASRFVLIETGGTRLYTDWQFAANDCLVFGRETLGLSADWLTRFPENIISIPMPNPRIRSLNLANAVSIVLYEALRQSPLQRV